MKNSGESKLFLGIVIVAAVLTAIALKPMLFSSNAADQVPRGLTRNDILPPGTRIQGDPKAPYVLVEFGDYQCPMCLTVMKPVEDLVAKHRDKLRYVFNYTTVVHGEHPYAETVARACEAAGLQGKFLQMHHAIFRDQPKFVKASKEQVNAEIVRVARSVGLDPLKLRADMSSKQVADAVYRQIEVGINLNVHMTPSFFIVKPDGTVKSLGSYADMKQWIDKPGNLK